MLSLLSATSSDWGQGRAEHLQTSRSTGNHSEVWVSSESCRVGGWNEFLKRQVSAAVERELNFRAISGLLESGVY